MQHRGYACAMCMPLFSNYDRRHDKLEKITPSHDDGSTKVGHFNAKFEDLRCRISFASKFVGLEFRVYDGKQKTHAMWVWFR